MKKFSHGCTLDCFDCCKFNVYKNENNDIDIKPDKNHPYTRGIMCSKGKKHLDRLNHKDRIYTPLKKVDGKWIEITFDEAISIIADKLNFYKKNYNSNSVAHYYESGTGGVLKSIQNIFFNFYGGITEFEGGTCWSAGNKAQKYDFGYVKGSSIDDIMNSQNIIVWGRNPYNTSIHLMDTILKAKKNGIKVTVIDPIHTETAKRADEYIRVNPSTDGALCMAMTKAIIEENLQDKEFISKHVKGYEEYKKYLDTLSLEYLSNECGVDIDTIKRISRLYAKKSSTIYIGYGVQKYRNGGNSIRSIDAMAAITGNIGKTGAGVNYANRVYPDILNRDPYNSYEYAINERYFNVHNFADDVKNSKESPIKAIFVTKANPLCRWPNLNKNIKAFSEIEFKVCIDMFMTDTSKYCDLFIPCTNTLESEDILYSSMCNPYIIYNEKVVDPKHILMDEYYFFMELSKKMNIRDYPLVSKEEYLKEIVKPLSKWNIEIEDIKKGYVNMAFDKVAWSDKIFKTPSEKIEIYSDNAKKDGLSPIPVYIKSQKKDIRLITTHEKNSLFTQHYLDDNQISIVYMNINLANKYQLSEDEIIVLKSRNGSIETKVKITDDVSNDIVHMYTRWANKDGNPNFLTEDVSSEMGGQVAYNETFVEIVKKC
ncbi:molybdopterin-dependent oxidoreductase [Tepidibacter mesophilus]|uniref:molybdopterin-dependent oxidoreductase n=1 Tax=Tepidibacter mesophilus TaxID=655607 RepID=UPI000C068565|nr:molybdopterin-dependent oxidoreductase [Tepidibacter mesophilus]